MSERYSNEQMSAMITSLEPLLERKDIIGYAAARNTRTLSNECLEYMRRRDQLIAEYGEPEIDANGNPTGRVRLSIASPKFADYQREIAEWGEIEHEPKLFKLKFEEAKGKISGAELLACDWMFED